MVDKAARCSYQGIEVITLGVASATVNSILDDHLRMKKKVTHWVSHTLNDFQEAERLKHLSGNFKNIKELWTLRSITNSSR